ncbi:MAG: T9SS type A sorting domain-containing protein [Flavobacteriales bacterium]|nr:T9SS type A sorting domain-containing protein [Flavobacteriales bacterium]
MKKFVLGVLFLLSAGSAQVFSQCGTCTPDFTCFAIGGTQCPLSGQAPPMYLNNPYSTVVTFDMPPDTNVAVVGTVQIINVQYASISGLPTGISWECNNAGNGCQYNPSQGETKACITFCGTPLAPPGNYTVTINIYGTASTPIGNQTQYQPLQYTFTILPDSASNGYYSMTPSTGCDSLTVDFEPVYEMPLPNLVTYDWDFGNGNTFSGDNPPVQSYDAPGTYYPVMNTNIYNLKVKKVTATASGNWWCGDVEEPNWPIVGCTAAPDIFFRLQHGTALYTSSSTSDNATGTWDNLNITLESALFTISMWDDDPTSQDDDGGFAAISVTGPGIFSFSTNSPFGGGTFGTVEVIQALTSVVTTPDTLTVYQGPSVVNINANPSDTVCEKEFVTLSVYPGNYTYEWYLNGQFIADTLGNSMTVTNQSGVYSVKVIDNATGCFSWMNPLPVYFKPGVFNTTASYNGGILTANPSSGFSYQWMFNGLPIFPGGLGSMYQPTVTGNYACIVSNGFGCSDTTNNILVTSLAGIQDVADFSNQVQLYPNPATEQITIGYYSFYNESAEIRIINQVGSVVKQVRQPMTAGENTLTISLDELASGMYIMELNSASGFAVKRFLKK